MNISTVYSKILTYYHERNIEMSSQELRPVIIEISTVHKKNLNLS